MTKFVFALVVTTGTQTISTEYFASIETCLFYAEKLNSQHVTHYNHTHRSGDLTILAQCLPARVDPETTEIFIR